MQLRQKIRDECLSQAVAKAFKDTMPDVELNTLPTDDSLKQQAEQLITPDFWLRAAGTESATLEAAVLATLRYNLEGSRAVVAARFTELGKYVRALKGTRALRQPISATVTSSWLQSAGPTMIAGAIEAGVQIWSATVGPQELFYLPSGFVKVDRALGQEASGFRLSWPFKEEPMVLPEMRAIVADLLTMGKRNALVDALVDIKQKELTGDGVAIAGASAGGQVTPRVVDGLATPRVDGATAPGTPVEVTELPPGTAAEKAEGGADVGALGNQDGEGAKGEEAKAAAEDAKRKEAEAEAAAEDAKRKKAEAEAAKEGKKDEAGA